MARTTKSVSRARTTERGASKKGTSKRAATQGRGAVKRGAAARQAVNRLQSPDVRLDPACDVAGAGVRPNGWSRYPESVMPDMMNLLGQHQ